MKSTALFVALLLALLTAPAMASAPEAKKNPDQVIFWPTFELEGVTYTGVHVPFGSRTADSQGYYFTYLGLGTHLFTTRDKRLLLGGVSFHVYIGTKCNESGGCVDEDGEEYTDEGYGMQISPIAIRLAGDLDRDGVTSLYLSPVYSRIWLANQKPINTVGLQLTLCVGGCRYKPKD